MIPRPDYLAAIAERVKHYPVVALLGPRQSGKTTLANLYAEGKPCEFFDLETLSGLDRLNEPMAALEPLRGLVVIDEVQRKPEIFQLLRVLADRRPLPARFLILGSASPWIVRGVSESLAGRVSFVDVSGLSLAEAGPGNFRQLWWRGGFPSAYTAASDRLCTMWQEDFIRTVLERDLPQLGITIPAATLRRFWTMIAHYHGQKWNAAELARSLGTSEPTTRKYLDILSGMFLVRQLPPWFENVGKRQVKAPKIYVRDSGLLHSLMKLDAFASLEAHPKLGASWEGFALEQVLSVTGDRDAYFWSTHSGPELDLLVFWHGRRVGFEFKYNDSPDLTKSMHMAMQDLKLDQLFVVYPGGQSFPLGPKAELVAIRDLPARLE
ncbi:MAG: ATP-binding protein, partial [Verrucomicrobia bacterium]|nr:ATP-binding protein [Verrucomicrobiota bacterium]